MSWLDWLRAGEACQYISRATYDQAEALTGYKRKSLQELAYVAGRVESSIRMEDLQWGHHQAVAPLDPDAQAAWLAQAAEKGWSVAALRNAWIGAVVLTLGVWFQR